MPGPKLISKTTLKPYVASLIKLAGIGFEYLSSLQFENAMEDSDDEVWLGLAIARDRMSALSRESMEETSIIRQADKQSVIVSKSILSSIVEVIRIGAFFEDTFNHRSALLRAVVLKEASLAIQEQNLSLALLRWRTISELLKSLSTESAVLAAIDEAIIELENSGAPEFATFLIIESLPGNTRFERQFLQAIELANEYNSMGLEWCP
jgi:hypothetical protein